MICFTSRHDRTNVLQREDRQLLLRVHPDHAVAQTLHGQHAAVRRGAALLHRPGGRRGTPSIRHEGADRRPAAKPSK